MAWSFIPLDIHLLGATSIVFWFGLLALISISVYQIISTAVSLATSRAKDKEWMEKTQPIQKVMSEIVKDSKQSEFTRANALICWTALYTGQPVPMSTSAISTIDK